MELGAAIDAIWPPSNPTKEALVLCVMGFVPFDEACHHAGLKPENRNYNGQRTTAAATSAAGASTLVKPSLHATNEPLSLPLSPSLSDAEAENSGATHTSSAAYALANKSCFQCFHGVWVHHRRRILDLVILVFAYGNFGPSPSQSRSLTKS